MIDLAHARKIFVDAEELFEDLDGLDLPEIDDITDQVPRGAAKPSRAEIIRIKSERAQASRDLMMLADRLAACEAVVRDAYWKFRGEESVFEPEQAS